MKRLATAALLTLATLTPALSETREDRLKLAEEYTAYAMEILDIEAMIRTMWQPFVDQAESQGKTLGEDQIAELDKLYQDTFKEPMMEIMRAQAPIIADLFTYEEISALNDFMRTEAGAAVMTKLPELTAAQQPIILELVQTELPKIMPELLHILNVH